MIQRVSQQAIQRQQAARRLPADRSEAGGGFGALLQQEIQKSAEKPAQSVAFSKHAISRAEERGIELTQDLMDQLAGSVERAQAKGAKNILAMDNTRAFIINVPNARVITAITQDEMKESIFTNIDGAVFL